MYSHIMTPDEIKDFAQFIHDRFANDPDFMESGRRNDHGVDWCIACRILDKDPHDLDGTQITSVNSVFATEVIDRVLPYTNGVWDHPKVTDAIDYLIDQGAYTDYHKARVAKQESV